MFIRQTLEKRSRGVLSPCLWLVLIAVVCPATSNRAQDIPLTDQNSEVRIFVNSDMGVHSWVVDGLPQLFQQWFWYRIGNAGGEHAINTISAPVFNATANTLSTTYSSAAFNINVFYTLQGGPLGSGVSDMTEVITINNTSGGILDLHFFQYSDFDLSGIVNQTAILTKNLNPLSPNFNKFIEADQINPTVTISETVITPGADHGEAGIYPNTINSLNDLNPTLLNDNATAGPGDATWALQWDFMLTANGVGSSVQISKDKHLTLLFVPEPSSLTLLGLGAAAYFVSRRRRAA